METMANLLRITEATSLALHTMALLAKHPGVRKSNLDISVTLHASQHTLAKVLNNLAKAGLADAVRGPHGGFMLAQEPKDMTLLQVYEAVEGQLSTAACLLGSPICCGTTCVLGGLVDAVQSQVRDYLAGTTVADLAGCITIRSRENM
jgi:Rrf2 family transcriptional regulator, nitric oxide-sensitive transcriptional repressor